MNEQNNQPEQLSLKFEGETSIDVDVLLNSLTNIIHAYKASINALYKGVEFEIKVNAIAPGSFTMALDTIVSNVPAIAGYVPTATSCVKTFLEIIKIKHKLGGKKPLQVEAKGSQTAVTNNSGEINYYNSTVYNMYFNTPAIDGALSSAFRIVDASQRPAFAISGAAETVRIQQPEYEVMKLPIVDEQSNDNSKKLSNVVDELLLLKSPDFLGDSKWSFQYGGRTIHASIEDDVFQEQVKKGKVLLFAGVKIPVQMRIEAFINESLDIIKYNYTILKVTGPIVGPSDYEQEQLAIESVYFNDES